MIPKTTVYLRADGNHQIGLGHVHRLLALCGILREGFHCVFISHCTLPGVRALLMTCADELIDLDSESRLINAFPRKLDGGEIAVLDGYQFDTYDQIELKSNCGALVCIDDLHKDYFVADVIINHCGGIDESVYSKEPYTKLLSGPKFLLLKKPFLDCARHRVKKAPGSLLICMGGSDPDNHTLTTLKQSLNLPFSAIYIVVGEAYAHLEPLRRAIQGNRSITLLRNLDPEGMVSIMNACEVAICSASVTAYEYLCTGGELYIIRTASNQTDLYNFLLTSGLAFPMDCFRISETIAARAIQKQLELVDGGSGRRVLRAFQALDFQLHTNMRAVHAQDMELLFRWVNEPELRAQSFNSDPISIEQHMVWFESKMNDQNTRIFIFEYKGTPFGQVRLAGHDRAVISYSLDKYFRGRGWGQLMLQQAIKVFCEAKASPVQLIGFVQRDNVASNVIFKNLGFSQFDTSEFPNSYRYELAVL